ncbi:MAG: 50S ribosomal protein L29 [Spirochaetia bacterium]|nr:50S ribosomal protein L29 [Spirochaetia bacterium]
MKVKIAELKDSEIVEQLSEATKQVREQRFQYAIARSLENPKIIRDLKKKIARLKTLQREREIIKVKK